MPKYIEKSFPIGILSQLAERESWRKEIYRPVYYIHKWWARRLGSIFRGIILAACKEEHENLLQDYYSFNNFPDITIFDPFMGSGVTIGEAAKLGCKVIGRDINPVSSNIVLAGLSPYNISDVEKAYKTIENKVKKRIRSFFKTKLADGTVTDVLYYFQVKTLNCPACENHIDLFKSRIFSKNATPKKDPSARALCPRCSAINHTLFDSRQTTCPDCNFKYDPQTGSVKGPAVSCPHCSHQFRLVDYLKNTDNPLDHRLYAKLVLMPDNSKKYEPVHDYDLELLEKACSEFVSVQEKIPPVAIKQGYNTNQVLKYNYRFWHQMFSPRQLLCISLVSDEIKNISDPALKRLFACLLSGVLEFNNLFCSFKGEGTGAVRHMFAHHILKPELMPIEANIWGTPKSSGSFSTLYKSRILRALDYKSDPFELQVKNGKSLKISNINNPLNCNTTETYKDFKKNGASVCISHGDSGNTDIDAGAVDLVVTDPPFFDNVHYSQLADFFYFWLNQILNISEADSTRHCAEVQDTKPDKFSEKLCGVFSECSRVLKKDGLLIFTYHHSRHEGWISVYNAIREAGFVCIQSFPVKAEMSVSVPIQQSKTPINIDLILVCTKVRNKKVKKKTDNILHLSAETAKAQITELAASGINVSTGDSKVALMGRLLCELSRMGDISSELEFLTHAEKEVNQFLCEPISKPGQKPAYKYEAGQVQLSLFESVEKYLADNTA